MEKVIINSLSSQETIPSVNKAIMKDVETADFIMTFLCARSPVLRAMVLADMEEDRKGEVDIDEDTLGWRWLFVPS